MKSKKSNGQGALPHQTIIDLVQAGHITGVDMDQVRQCSLDLTISSEIYQVEGIFQPKKSETVRQVLGMIRHKKHSILQPLECNKMYIIRLNETLSLPDSVYAFCNPKSTSGRIDIHVRLLSDRTSRYDTIPHGFRGELWISVIPKTFPVLVYPGLSLNQLRLFNADRRLSDLELEIAMNQYQLLWRKRNNTAYAYDEIRVRDNDSSVILTLDLAGPVIGYEGVCTDAVLDLSKINYYNYKHYFKPLKLRNGILHLKKNAFYILSTHESVRVPPELACEMTPMDERSGEFRSHYAGFIDPGWGWGIDGEGVGRPLTLEVRPFEDIIVRQGQPIAKIKFERTAAIPDLLYDATGSNYTVQSGPKLAKHFK